MLIGEKLLANEAETLGLHRDSAFQQWQRYTESVAVGKELYREEVQSKVDVRESEIDTALTLTQKSMQIKFFKSARREDAERFLKIAAVKKSFELAMQGYFGSVVSAETYTSRFTFGDDDEQLETAVFALQPGQISGVIKTSRGGSLSASRCLIDEKILGGSSGRKIEKHRIDRNLDDRDASRTTEPIGRAFVAAVLMSQLWCFKAGNQRVQCATRVGS